jgi:hypothetical protein
MNEPAPLAAGRGRSRAVTVTLATLGLLVITAASATVTVAVGKPEHKHKAASAAPSPAPVAGIGNSPSPVPEPLPSITLGAAAGSNLHGTFDGSTHGGDLRFFLVPIPDGGESYGSADGTTVSRDDLAQEYSKSSDIQSILDSYGYQEAVSRRYRTADGREEVEAQLMRFSSPGNAGDFAKNANFSDATTIDVAGDSNAKGFVFKPEQQAWTGHMIGISHVGDVEYEVTVDMQGDPDPAVLADAMKRQHDRLSNGG